jgi:hypothetical protein
MQPPLIDVGDELRESHLLTLPDLLQAAPERILETDAGLMPGDYN